MTRGVIVLVASVKFEGSGCAGSMKRSLYYVRAQCI